MSKPYPEEIVLAYVQSHDKDHLFITLALYDHEANKWIDMMRDKNNQENLKVITWFKIDPPPLPYKLFTSMKMHYYRIIYLNNVCDKG